MSSLIFSNEGFGIWTVSFQPVVPQLKGETKMLDMSKYFELKKVGDITVATLTQPRLIDGDYVDDLGRRLAGLARDNPRIKLVLNLERVDFMCSSMMGKIITLFKEVRIVDGELKLCRIKVFVRAMMEITRLDTLFEIYKNEDEAISAF